MTITYINPASRDKALLGYVADADLGSANAKIQYFTDATKPTTDGGTPVGAPVVEMVLTKPCGHIAAHVLVLTQDDTDGDLIANSGLVTFGRLVAGDGHVVFEGDVSDDSGTGLFRIEGASGTTLYAGGRSILGAVELT